MDPTGNYSYPPPSKAGFGGTSRYVRFFQSRRSLLVWKIFGRRLDGFKNDDFAYETEPGNPASLQDRGRPMVLPDKIPPLAWLVPAVDIGYTGSVMPPAEAVAGTYEGPGGQLIQVPALSDEDKLTVVRWIDLGCPIDLDYDPVQPNSRSRGWLADDSRPTLTMTTPVAAANPKLTRILIGMHDIESGLDIKSFQVVADFDLDGVKAGTNLASKFNQKSPGIWELTLANPLKALDQGRLTASVKDKQGNVNKIERKFSVKPAGVRGTDGSETR
jgi:hypothetical protein